MTYAENIQARINAYDEMQKNLIEAKKKIEKIQEACNTINRLTPEIELWEDTDDLSEMLDQIGTRLETASMGIFFLEQELNKEQAS